MIFWSLCAFIWFRNIEKMLLQMTSVSLQPVPTLHNTFHFCCFLLVVRELRGQELISFTNFNI
jgi:hypothetical protein